MWKPMCSRRRQLALLVLLFVFFNSVAFAAESIPASKNGPMAALVSAGKSVYLLPFLLHADGSTISPCEYRTLADSRFVLVSGAAPDSAKTHQLLADVQNCGNSTASPVVKCPPTVPCPRCEPKVVEKVVEVEKKVGNRLTVTIPSYHRIPVGGSVEFDGVIINGVLAHDLRIKQGDEKIAKFVAYQGKVKITGVNPGKTAFVLWSATDETVRHYITVEVLGDTKVSYSANDYSGLIKTLILLALAVVLFGFLIVMLFRLKEHNVLDTSVPPAAATLTPDPSAARSTPPPSTPRSTRRPTRRWVV